MTKLTEISITPVPQVWKLQNQLDAPVIVMGFPMVYKSVPHPFAKKKKSFRFTEFSVMNILKIQIFLHYKSKLVFWGYLIFGVKTKGSGSSFYDSDLSSHLFVGIGTRTEHWN
jgi:hypothetical protein